MTLSPAATMKAVRIQVYGPPEVLHYEDAPRPEVRPGEVLVHVHAASVNAIDWRIRAGYLRQVMPYSLPLILGLDFSGTVDSVGSDVSGHAVGEEIYGRVDTQRLGTYAEYVLARAGEFTAKPRSIDHVHAAAVPLAALTAWQSLIAGAKDAPSIGLQKGQRILIQGAAGGVGSFAVQLAKWRGAQVIVTAKGVDAAFVSRLGADQVIDYTREPFEDWAGQVDAVLDLVGGETQTRSWKILREGGTLASTMGQPSEREASGRRARAVAVMTSNDVGQLDEIARLIEAGTLTPAVNEVFPLEQAAAAHQRLEAHQVQGKVVLEVA